jgi:hypothetical protein
MEISWALLWVLNILYGKSGILLLCRVYLVYSKTLKIPEQGKSQLPKALSVKDNFICSVKNVRC